MSYRKYLDGMVPFEDCLFVMVVGDTPENGDSLKVDPDGYQYLRNGECFAKMLQPVVCNGHSAFNSANAGKTLADMAWYVGDEPESRPNSFWSEAAIRKMCEPTGHGHAILLDKASLDRLACML